MSQKYTHFKGNHLSRSELVQRMVVEAILQSPVPDEKRDWSKVFELKHSSSVVQTACMLAQKRGLNQEMAVLGAVLHDIAVFKTGSATNHAINGANIVTPILQRMGVFSDEEIGHIALLVREHSNKHLISADSLVELVKDADVFDCSLLEGAYDAYREQKSSEIVAHYFARIQKVRAELGLPHDKQWDL
ncbi:HD domain-containing protein [Candidatus Uhrbacteria bacterium]|nr:HD domain-containing protein [Candidatus Uhrbacteria bacterium]